jgi:hypothetical protein
MANIKRRRQWREIETRESKGSIAVVVSDVKLATRFTSIVAQYLHHSSLLPSPPSILAAEDVPIFDTATEDAPFICLPTILQC